MIAWVASPKVANYTIISVNSCLAKRRQFCGFQKLKARRLLCFLSSVGTTSKGSTNNRTPTSPINPSLPHSKPNKPHTARGLHLHRRSPLFLGYTNLFIGTVSHDTIFLKEYSARKPPWPHSKPSRGCGTVRQWRGCGLRHAARTDARRCRGTVRSPSATSA